MYTEGVMAISLQSPTALNETQKFALELKESAFPYLERYESRLVGLYLDNLLAGIYDFPDILEGMARLRFTAESTHVDFSRRMACLGFCMWLGGKKPDHVRAIVALSEPESEPESVPAD